MTKRKEIPIELRSLRIAAIVNTSSGGCDSDCPAKIVDLLRKNHIALTSLECVEGKDVNLALQKTLAARAEVLIVLGGDGTIRTAGELCSQSATSLIPLPGGTLNMLPKALYGDSKWDDVLSQILAAPKSISIGGGDVEGHQFFCAGIFGAPALWGDAREAVRKSRWRDAFRAAIRAYRRTRSQKITYRFDGGTWEKTVALSAICPLISARVGSDDRTFDIVGLHHQNIGDAATLAWKAVFEEWRMDKNVTSLRAEKVELRAGARIPAILDGEKVTLSRMPEVEYIDTCFNAIVPASI